MQIFSNYVQPLTFWLYDHPHLALMMTFLISFTESLAIIGSIIPGSVTMTAIGILAGSGVMRIDLTFIFAVLGAVAGDSMSYLLGYTFSHRLTQLWPFSRYPKWLNYGKEFFTKHGGKSVLIGRFVGPLRSIIPVIAGMLHMRRWHFLLANIASAIGWAILYVMPGVLIGAASNELSPDSATHLFIVILLFLGAIWLLSLGIRWVFLNANHLLHANLKTLWALAGQYKPLATFFKYLSPRHEKNHYPTIMLVLSIIACFIMSFVFSMLVLQDTWILSTNILIHHFFQSLRTQLFDVFFIILRLAINPIPLAVLALSIMTYAVCYRDWRMLRYWLSLCLTSLVMIWLLSLFGKPIHPSINLTTQAFPELNLTLATSLFSFLIYYSRNHYQATVTRLLHFLLLTLLFFVSMSLLYLSDSTLLGIGAAYFIGSTIALIHWIFYRRLTSVHQRSLMPVIVIFLVSILAFTLSYRVYFKQLIHEHTLLSDQYVLTHQNWWTQQQPLLPLFTTNRFGHRIGLFNIQYAGSLNRLQKTLGASGWKPQSNLFFYSLLMRAGGGHSMKELPVMAQLYLNNKPELIMTYDTGTKGNLFILRLWRSNYHLHHYHQPIWLGSIIYPHSSSKGQVNRKLDSRTLFSPILSALNGFKYTLISLPVKQVQLLPQNVPANILIIKEISVQ